MHYYLYEIKNNVNGKIYIGVHKTSNLNDGYMGSGKIIKSAMAKYGIENFTKIILEFFDTSEDMFRREKEIVTEEFLKRDDVYNLRCGGFGGFDYINSNGLTAKYLFTEEDVKKAVIACQSKDWGLINRSRHAKYSKDIRRDWSSEARNVIKSEDSKKKRRDTFDKIGHQRCEKNSQFGTIWITDGHINKKIKKCDDIPEGWKRGRVKNIV